MEHGHFVVWGGGGPKRPTKQKGKITTKNKQESGWFFPQKDQKTNRQNKKKGLGPSEVAGHLTVTLKPLKTKSKQTASPQNTTKNKKTNKKTETKKGAFQVSFNIVCVLGSFSEQKNLF